MTNAQIAAKSQESFRRDVVTLTSGFGLSASCAVATPANVRFPGERSKVRIPNKMDPITTSSPTASRRAEGVLVAEQNVHLSLECAQRAFTKARACSLR
jgi:hypothetical protein